MSEKKMIKYTGGCICGSVKYSVKLDEIPRVWNCHCIDCRKKMGGINTIVELRDAMIDIDKSKLSFYEHLGGSGNKLRKHYCKECTTPVYSYVEKWDKIYLYAGLLDNISMLKTAKNICYEDSHFPFLEIKEKGFKI